jgi:hypothetical protein
VLAVPTKPSWGIIDPPARSAPLQTWERHLQFLRSLPDGTVLKNELISTAEQRIAEKKQGGPFISLAEANRAKLDLGRELNAIAKRAQRDFYRGAAVRRIP